MDFLAKASPDQPAPTSAGTVALPSLYMPYHQSRAATPASLLIAHLLLSMIFAPLASANAAQRSRSGSAEKPNTEPCLFSLTKLVKSSCVQPSFGGVFTISVL